jgi:hypothetical protein
MGAKLLFLILPLFTIILSAPIPPIDSLSIYPQISSSPSSILARISRPTSPSLPREEVTETLSTEHINAGQNIQRRNWSKLQKGVFWGWIVPLGLGVMFVLIWVPFGDRLKAALRGCLAKQEGLTEAPTA